MLKYYSENSLGLAHQQALENRRKSDLPKMNEDFISLYQAVRSLLADSEVYTNTVGDIIRFPNGVVDISLRETESQPYLHAQFDADGTLQKYFMLPEPGIPLITPIIKQLVPLLKERDQRIIRNRLTTFFSSVLEELHALKASASLRQYKKTL